MNIYEDYWSEQFAGCSKHVSPLLADRDPVKTIDVARDPQAGVGLSDAGEGSGKETNTGYKAEENHVQESFVTSRRTLGAELSSSSEDPKPNIDTRPRDYTDDCGNKPDSVVPRLSNEVLSNNTEVTDATSDLEVVQVGQKFGGRGITCLNFAPGPNGRKIAAAYSSNIFCCPSDEVPRTAYVWDISKQLSNIYYMIKIYI